MAACQIIRLAPVSVHKDAIVTCNLGKYFDRSRKSCVGHAVTTPVSTSYPPPLPPAPWAHTHNAALAKHAMPTQ